MNPRSYLTVLPIALMVASCSAEAPEAEAEAPPVTTSASEVAEPAAAPVAGARHTDITVPELQAMLEDEDFDLVNVHIPYAGDLPNTDYSIPFDEIESNLAMLPEDKDAKIVLYCRTGRMSTTAGETLTRLGYTNVYNLVGGFVAWAEAGLPMVGQ